MHAHTAHLDHLVVAARTLAEGVAWCEATLGVVPGPGGAHPLMGTHNRLLNIASDAFARAYLEIIAIDPAATPTRATGLNRWFDLDDTALQADLAQPGPQLVHFVARVPDLRAARLALSHEPVSIDRGRIVEASRDTLTGRLDWQITIRDDGQRLFHGALPTLIQWGPAHPVDAMPVSGLHLRSMHLTHPRAPALAEALNVMGLGGMNVVAGPPKLVAVLDTPGGPVTLESKNQ